jgi:AcrR family transcriptional regulator
MARWDPDARGRLARAAMELYAERGFDETTVADIARRAGLTERTFFRHFADKREVLFAGSSRLQDLMVAAVADAPASATPIEAVAAGVVAAATVLTDRAFSRHRQALIESHPTLQERELIKMATLGSAFASALRGRGVTEPGASLTAEAAIAVFRVAFDAWVKDAGDRSLSALIAEAFAELRSLVAQPAGARTGRASPRRS